MDSSNQYATTLDVDGEQYTIFSFERCGEAAGNLPYSLKLLLENLLRHESEEFVTPDDIDALVNWDPAAPPDQEIAFVPARVLLQDFTGVPAIVDLAVMRDAMVELGATPAESTRWHPWNWSSITR